MNNEPGEGDAVAVVIGASGGVGAALVEQLAAGGRFLHIVALSRSTPAVVDKPTVVRGRIDLADEPSIIAAAEQARAVGGEIRLVIVATGLLHDGDVAPEKSWASLDAAAMARCFAVNSIGPALVAKHFLPLLPRKRRSVFAALSARVGSIGDNRLGGWYSYRASKAALNMLLKTCAIELERRAPQAICVGLHPGTVDTALSKPFSANVRPQQLFTAEQSAAHLLSVIDGLRATDSGRVFAWDGQPVPP
ncbi:SDR family NAD(P)-dependent oxidoreductase [Piscinibacter sakaiensis]|uniref:SDR family NAD(P)-dependent oxidoreductase n=1 Tax=Piscinibacter sakaiensis TaxID=1547922 RepID=UPI003AADEC16